MAKFTLSAMTTSGEVVLTYFDANSLQFGGLSFDESVSASTDTSSLTFSALKYRIENGQQVINLPITMLTYGTVIRLYERNVITEYKIQNINYTFLPDNLQLQFTCLDRFQAEASKIGVGYTIQNDTTDPDFLGAQSIDTWARKIIKETNLPWGYIGVDEANDALIRQLASAAAINLRDDLPHGSDWDEINDALINEFQSNPATLNAVVSFECSGTNAFEALKKLATDNELILRVDYLNNNIYFIPQKNWWFKGYYFNPHINLQQFALQGSNENMATVLNVTGARDINDQEITLVPSIPEDFESYVTDSDWEHSVYYNGFFQDHSTDKVFGSLAEQIPWFENKLIDTSFFNDKILSPKQADDINNILVNDLRKVNVPLIIATRAHYKNVEKWMMQLNQYKIEAENAFGAMVSILDNCFDALPKYGNQHMLLAFYDGDNLLLPAGEHMYVKINGQTYTSSNGWIVMSWGTISSWSQPVLINYYVDSISDTIGVLPIDTTTKQNIFELPSYTAPTLGDYIPELDYFLNEQVAPLNAAWQTLNKNAYLLRKYWEENNYRHESFYYRFRKVGVLAKEINIVDGQGLDVTMDEEIKQGVKYSTAYATTLSRADILALASYFNVTPPSEESPYEPINVTRSQIIQECANIAAKMTEYWNAMRTAGLQQGCYLPTTWDCLDIILDTSIDSPWFNYLLPLKKENGHYILSSTYGRSAVMSTNKQTIMRYKYFDQQRDVIAPLQTNNVEYHSLDPERVVQSNTENYYVKINGQNTDYTNLWFSGDCQRPVSKSDTVKLYRTRLKYLDYTYAFGSFMSGKCYINANSSVSVFNSNNVANSIIYQLYNKLLNTYVEGTTMYQLQAEHDKIWQHLYATYPGIFCETTYENNDAATSMDLYFAAKAQLAALNHPEFSYSLTGIDIYSHEGQLLLWNVQLGDQVRIDYVEDETRVQVVDQALREPLYVTSINHSLRDDANYQFEIATRKATDTMVRRFAQLLTLGR